MPAPSPLPNEIGKTDLTGRAIKGYQLTEKIGSGSFGIVYKAVQPSVRRDVAIKIILPHYANQSTFIRRFESEAYLIARIEHPHIVPLYDYWREPDAAYLIMRLLRGGNLETFLQQGPLSLDRFRTLATQIGKAISFAHSQGIIHRDIKPANILLDEAQNGYLADFGIAKLLDQNLNANFTVDGALIGTPAYISPEQIQSEPLGPYTDIYCFGLLLYEMLSGQKAFSGPTPASYFHQHLNEPTPRLRSVISDIPLDLDDLIQKATEKQPENRFPSMSALLKSLEEIWTTFKAPVKNPNEAIFELSAEEIEILGNPFMGLRSFNEADASNFYGRESFVDSLLKMLSDGSDLERFMAVVGPSGSGKSSVVKAGLLPALRQGALPNSDKWFIVDITPGAHPWEEVEIACSGLQ